MAPPLPQHLPQHLQDLVDQMPLNYRFKDNVLLRNRRLITYKPEPGEVTSTQRNYRYWLTSTGEEVAVKFYPQGNRTGVLVGASDSLGNFPVILGRDPKHKAKMFKDWRGVDVEFGADADDAEVIAKELEEPQWVQVVRSGGTYHEWAGDAPKDKKRRRNPEQGEHYLLYGLSIKSRRS